MKNITLAVDEQVLEAVRLYAAEHKTTVNALVRSELERLAKAEDRVARARRRIRELANDSQAQMGPVTWKRDDLHER
ncbi:MAG: CopG family transcriptional regulator [Rhizobiales bacterium]|nr:CopG family transcriptional regulator [Hyphomicrobiales bacterium]MBI3674049.1 CopG family transcriptional regulator [Hyphomicrobiales bacterium]